MAVNVLIVDDSAIIRKMVKRTLDMTGVELGEVHEATNGKEALEILDGAWIDVVFADIHMPVMTGDEMIERLAEDDVLKTTPVVIISSDRSKALMDKLKALGVKDYLTKPFRPEQLKAVLDDLLGAQ